MAGNFLKKSRHGTVYYFRRRVPSPIQHVIGRAIIVQSLQTSDRRLAIIRSRAFAAQTDAIFQRLIMTKNSGKKELFGTDYSLKIDFGDLGLPSSITILDARPDEQEAVNSAIRTALEGIGSREGKAGSPKVQKRFVDAVSEFYRESQIKASSLRTFRARLDLAKGFFGADSDVLSIDQGRFTDFCDHVKKAKADSSVTTQNLYMENVAHFVNWHLENRFGKNAPTVTPKSRLIKKTTPDSEDRDAFTLEQLRLIFENAKQYRECSPCKFWASIVPAFTGCRIEEVSQINLKTDLKEDAEAGIWYLLLDGRPDADGVVRKSIKKLSNWRVAPIHPTLVKHGFVDFLKDQRRGGHSRPFESEWKPHEADDPEIGHVLKWSHAIAKWGGRELKSLAERHNFGGKLTYFHSQRHACKGILSAAGVEERISEAIAGRRYASSDSERYGKLKNDHRELYNKGIEVGLNALAEILDDVLGE